MVTAKTLDDLFPDTLRGIATLFALVAGWQGVCISAIYCKCRLRAIGLRVL